MVHKKKSRLRRAKRSRAKIAELRVPRLCVYRSSKHIYAQVFSDDSARVLVSASTVDRAVKSEIEYGGNITAAKIVGKLVAERAKQMGVSRVAFDRSGFQFHGRVQALAEAARENGLDF